MDLRKGKKSAQSKSSYNRTNFQKASAVVENNNFNDPFAERLVTYLQVSQYKLIKAYRSIAAQEKKHRLINIISSVMRRSLDPDEIIKVAVQEIGEALLACRCLIYQCRPADTIATITHEYLGVSVKSVLNQVWPLKENSFCLDTISFFNLMDLFFSSSNLSS